MVLIYIIYGIFYHVKSTKLLIPCVVFNKNKPAGLSVKGFYLIIAEHNFSNFNCKIKNIITQETIILHLDFPFFDYYILIGLFKYMS